MKLLLKSYLAFILFTSCNSFTKTDNVFLDYSLGMTEKEYNVKRNALISAGEISSEPNLGDIYIFNPVGVNAEVVPYFNNNHLFNLALDFGYYDIIDKIFRRYESVNSIREIINLYTTKYGPYRVEKRQYVTGDLDELIWDNNSYTISFIYESIEAVNSLRFNNVLCYKNARISYNLKKDKREQLLKNVSTKRLKDL